MQNLKTYEDTTSSHAQRFYVFSTQDELPRQDDPMITQMGSTRHFHQFAIPRIVCPHPKPYDAAGQVL